MRVPVALVLLLLACPAQAAAPDPRLAGRWEGLDSIGRCRGFVFGADGKVTAFVSRGEVIIPDARRLQAMRYETDAAAAPATIDLVMTDTEGKEQRRLLAIYRLSAPNVLELRTNYSDERPPGFEPGAKPGVIALQRLTRSNQALVCRAGERAPK